MRVPGPTSTAAGATRTNPSPVVTLAHDNVARVEDGLYVVDRKFADGMRHYRERLPLPIVSVHPQAAPDAPIMDPVRLPLAGLGYEVLTVEGADFGPLRDLVGRSALVYGVHAPTIGIAREMHVPYALIREYDLSTRLMVSVTSTNSLPRGLVRAARALLHERQARREVRGAEAVHCNGYPAHDAVARYARRRLLYLDSRNAADALIGRDALEARLATLASRRPMRLLYSGRYEAIKGALHAVRAVAAALGKGARLTLDCYGQGAQGAAMRALAQPFADRIRIHEAIPFPELVARSRSFDAFVCCHVQNDPSCTYLEAFGAGLPIIGYANRMWRRLCEASGAGRVTPLAQPSRLATELAGLASDPSPLVAWSRRALAFASAHTADAEFGRRVADLEALLADVSRSGPSCARTG